MEDSCQSLSYTVNEILNDSHKLFHILDFLEGTVLTMLPSFSLSIQSFGHLFTSEHYVPTPRLALMPFAIYLFWCKGPKEQPETPLGKTHTVDMSCGCPQWIRVMSQAAAAAKVSSTDAKCLLSVGGPREWGQQDESHPHCTPQSPLFSERQKQLWLILLL